MKLNFANQVTMTILSNNSKLLNGTVTHNFHRSKIKIFKKKTIQNRYIAL